KCLPFCLRVGARYAKGGEGCLTAQGTAEGRRTPVASQMKNMTARVGSRMHTHTHTHTHTIKSLTAPPPTHKLMRACVSVTYHHCLHIITLMGTYTHSYSHMVFSSKSHGGDLEHKAHQV